jgi:hypothetical protein
MPLPYPCLEFLQARIIFCRCIFAGTRAYSTIAKTVPGYFATEDTNGDTYHTTIITIYYYILSLPSLSPLSPVFSVILFSVGDFDL